MLRNRLLLLFALSLASAACDNVGRVFDPSIDPTSPTNEAGESPVQVVPVGGDARDGVLAGDFGVDGAQSFSDQFVL